MTKHSLAQLEAEALAAVYKLGVPPCPQVLIEIGRELRLESPDVHKVANLITHDASSSAAILKTVNSAYYGLSSKARSVQQAIAYLGLNRASYLLAGLLLRNAFPTSNKRALVRFWDMSTQLALSAAYVARILGTVDRDEAHTYGLFRDVGSAVLICKFDDYDDVSARANAAPLSGVTVVEKERFGTDHAVIGAVFARDWQLPEEMSEAILWHHADFVLDLNDRPIPDESVRLIAIGLLCDCVLADYEGGKAGDEMMLLTAQALRALNVPESKFAELRTAVMVMLDEAAVKPMPTIRVQAGTR